MQLRLRTKLTLIMTGLVLLVVAVLSAVFVAQLFEQVLQQTDKRTVEIANQVFEQARRALTELEHQLFRFHFLLGADWKLCSRKLNLERGNFFHAVYRIEQKLGRVFRELQPYALFPLEDYFQGPSRIGADVRAVAQVERKVPEHLQFPPIGRAA